MTVYINKWKKEFPYFAASAIDVFASEAAVDARKPRRDFAAVI